MSLTRSATVDYDGVGCSRPDSCPGHATGPLGSNIITQRSKVQIHAPLPSTRLGIMWFLALFHITMAYNDSRL